MENFSGTLILLERGVNDQVIPSVANGGKLFRTISCIRILHSYPSPGI
jgi:hypothetical protein